MFPCVYFKLESFTMCTKKAISTQTQWNKNRVLGTCSRVFSFMLVKRSLSIYMLSIQIDTKSLELVIYPATSNCPPLQAIWNGIYAHFIDAVRFLDALIFIVPNTVEKSRKNRHMVHQFCWGLLCLLLAYCFSFVNFGSYIVSRKPKMLLLWCQYRFCFWHTQ